AGKLGDRVWVRSTKRTCLLSIAWIKAANGFLSLISSPTWVLCRRYRCLPCMAQDRDQPVKQPAPSGPAPPSLQRQLASWTAAARPRRFFLSRSLEQRDLSKNGPDPHRERDRLEP